MLGRCEDCAWVPSKWGVNGGGVVRQAPCKRCRSFLASTKPAIQAPGKSHAHSCYAWQGTCLLSRKRNNSPFLPGRGGAKGGRGGGGRGGGMGGGRGGSGGGGGLHSASKSKGLMQLSTLHVLQTAPSSIIGRNTRHARAQAHRHASAAEGGCGVSTPRRISHTMWVNDMNT